MAWVGGMRHHRRRVAVGFHLRGCRQSLYCRKALSPPVDACLLAALMLESSALPADATVMNPIIMDRIACLSRVFGGLDQPPIQQPHNTMQDATFLSPEQDDQLEDFKDGAHFNHAHDNEISGPANDSGKLSLQSLSQSRMPKSSRLKRLAVVALLLALPSSHGCTDLKVESTQTAHIGASSSSHTHRPQQAVGQSAEQQPAGRSTGTKFLAESLPLASVLPSARSLLQHRRRGYGRRVYAARLSAALALFVAPSYVAATTAASPAPDSVSDAIPEVQPKQVQGIWPGNESRVRKNWTSHVSASFNQRRYTLIGIYIAVILASAIVYWTYLRVHMPLSWAAPFCLFVCVVGFLYNTERGYIVNEVLAFACGMAVFFIYKIVSRRTGLGTCECRLCMREIIVLRKLGEGSFGSVYKCRTTSRASEGRNIKCVVKRVQVDFDKDINDASEALQEAKSLIKLEEHPYIVRYMDVWLHRETPVSPFQQPSTEVCIMMEYCSKGDLFDRLEKMREELKETGIPMKQLQMWCAQVCEAVTFIHSKGITHCDLKLENLFLSDSDSVKLGDFGLSLQLKKRRASDMASTTLASPFQETKNHHNQVQKQEQKQEHDAQQQAQAQASSSPVQRSISQGHDHVWGSTKMGSRGTPDYMAPECWGSVSKYTAKVDVWSLGVIFYMMLTGKTPMHHVQDACVDDDVYLGTVANKTGAGADYDYFKELDVALALVERQDWRAVIRRMLDPDPALRPTMTQVMRDLNLRVKHPAKLRKARAPQPPTHGRSLFDRMHNVSETLLSAVGYNSAGNSSAGGRGHGKYAAPRPPLYVAHSSSSLDSIAQSDVPSGGGGVGVDMIVGNVAAGSGSTSGSRGSKGYGNHHYNHKGRGHKGARIKLKTAEAVKPAAVGAGAV